MLHFQSQPQWRGLESIWIRITYCRSQQETKRKQSECAARNISSYLLKLYNKKKNYAERVARMELAHYERWEQAGINRTLLSGHQQWDEYSTVLHCNRQQQQIIRHLLQTWSLLDSAASMKELFLYGTRHFEESLRWRNIFNASCQRSTTIRSLRCDWLCGRGCYNVEGNVPIKCLASES